jgi:hypothetical protein
MVQNRAARLPACPFKCDIHCKAAPAHQDYSNVCFKLEGRTKPAMTSGWQQQQQQ